MMCFCTVGTTKFDELIDKVTRTEFIDLLIKLGFKKLLIQTGNSTIPNIPKSKNFLIELYTFKPSILQDIQNATLILSSGGSGTILECLENHKKLLVIVNSSLQDNHQLELSRELNTQGYLMMTNMEQLNEKFELLHSQFKPKEWTPSKDGSLKLIDVFNELLY
ncbi:glycosyl transferase [Globomyces pollinis-pini]|nr:glycosyl transferase [Globomyces pollinis-pini]